MKKIKKCSKYILLTILILVIFFIWDTKNLKITEYTISNEKIPKAFSGFVIVQVSDLHNDVFGKENSKLLNKIEKINPDIIVVTGDLVDSRRTNISIGIQFIKNAIDIAPTYYVTGNHEFRFYDEYLLMEEEMKKIGVNVLRNEEQLIEKEGEFIQIVGIDSNIIIGDSNYVPGTNNVVVKEMLKNLNDKKFYSVLLSHRPELFNMYEEQGLDLVFTGHTHGGQMRIPFVGGIIAPNQGFFPKYDGGLFTENNTTMIVSRGIGNSIIPIRINNRPEIVVTKLKNKK